MWLEEVFCDWLDLAKDLLMLVKNVLELVEVHLEFFFLKENDSSGFGDLDMLSFEALGFTNKLKNCDVKVDVEGACIRFSYD